MNMFNMKILHFSDVTSVTGAISITTGIAETLWAFTSDNAATCKIWVISLQMETNAFMFVIDHAKVMVCRKTLQEINLSWITTCECI